MHKHWHGGAGLHGYLYQDGPHYFKTREDAIAYFADSYDLCEGDQQILRLDRYLELSLEDDGNAYIEISPCDEGCKPEDCE